MFLSCFCQEIDLDDCVFLISKRSLADFIKENLFFFREFGQIFDGGKTSSTNTLIDYLLKTCLLCFLWYFSCYLLFRSMTILLPVEILILYSITVTLRQVLGWIFLQEEFIGNKVSENFVKNSMFCYFLLDHCTYSGVVWFTFVGT